MRRFFRFLATIGVLLGLIGCIFDSSTDSEQQDLPTLSALNGKWEQKDDEDDFTLIGVSSTKYGFYTYAGGILLGELTYTSVTNTLAGKIDYFGQHSGVTLANISDSLKGKVGANTFVAKKASTSTSFGTDGDISLKLGKVAGITGIKIAYSDETNYTSSEIFFDADSSDLKTLVAVAVDRANSKEFVCHTFFNSDNFTGSLPNMGTYEVAAEVATDKVRLLIVDENSVKYAGFKGKITIAAVSGKSNITLADDIVNSVFLIKDDDAVKIAAAGLNSVSEVLDAEFDLFVLSGKVSLN